MIAISSHKPFHKSPEVAKNQIRARNSWACFEEIHYFGDPEPELDGANTCFHPCVGWPTIKDLSKFASECDGWSCIINADIVVGDHWDQAEEALLRSGARCAISRRYGLWTHKLEDWGLDFFAAKPEVWKLAHQSVDPVFRIGHQLWDTWMISFFTHQPGILCADLTPAMVIFHPQHGDREFGHTITKPVGDKLIDDVRWPAIQITNVTNSKGQFTVR